MYYKISGKECSMLIIAWEFLGMLRRTHVIVFDS